MGHIDDKGWDKPLRTDTATWMTVGAAGVMIYASPSSSPAGVLCLVGLSLMAGVVARSTCAVRLSMLFFGLTYGFYAWSLGHVSLAGWGAIVVLGSLYGGLFAFALRGVAARTPRLYPIAFGAAWAAVEALRAHWPGIAWQHAQVASFFFDLPSTLYSARFVGESGCNMLVATFAATSWGFMHAPHVARSCRWLAAGLILIVVLCASLVRDLEADGEAIDVAIVQTGVPAYSDQARSRLRSQEALYQHYRELASEIPDCDLAIWPETALSGFFFEEGERERAQLRPLLPLFGKAKAIVIGGLRVEKGVRFDPQWGPEAYRNVAYYLERAGEGAQAHAAMRAVHEKTALVPGGEALPFWLAWCKSIWPRVWRVLPGRPQALAELPDGRGFGMPICYENCFPSRFAHDAKRGASFFAIPSFEAWYRQGRELDQMLAMSVLRAIETGRPLLRSTSDGISCLVRPDGSVEACARGLHDEIKVVKVQPRTGTTLAMRIGWLVPWGAALLAIFLRVFAGRRGLHERVAEARGFSDAPA